MKKGERMKNRMMILAMIGILVGCGNPYPEFYRLTAEGPLSSGGGVGIGVGPVILAEYVDRSNLVVETGPNKLEVAKYHRWAGDLDNSISRVVSVNLGRKLGTGNVRVYPWQRDSEIDYQVSMDISEFVAGDDGYARIEVSWRIYELPGRKLVASDIFVGREAIEKGDFESMVAAQSRLLGKFSDEVAKVLKRRM